MKISELRVGMFVGFYRCEDNKCSCLFECIEDDLIIGELKKLNKIGDDVFADVQCIETHEVFSVALEELVVLKEMGY